MTATFLSVTEASSHESADSQNSLMMFCFLGRFGLDINLVLHNFFNIIFYLKFHWILFISNVNLLGIFTKLAV